MLDARDGRAHWTGELSASALSTARQKLTDLESRFNDAAPEVRDQKSQVEAQLESIRNYVSSRAARAAKNWKPSTRLLT